MSMDLAVHLNIIILDSFCYKNGTYSVGPKMCSELDFDIFERHHALGSIIGSYESSNVFLPKI